jgi:hypothetical protein
MVDYHLEFMDSSFLKLSQYKLRPSRSYKNRMANQNLDDRDVNVGNVTDAGAVRGYRTDFEGNQ